MKPQSAAGLYRVAQNRESSAAHHDRLAETVAPHIPDPEVRQMVVEALGLWAEADWGVAEMLRKVIADDGHDLGLVAVSAAFLEMAGY